MRIAGGMMRAAPVPKGSAEATWAPSPLCVMAWLPNLPLTAGSLPATILARWWPLSIVTAPNLHEVGLGKGRAGCDTGMRYDTVPPVPSATLAYICLTQRSSKSLQPHRYAFGTPFASGLCKVTAR